MPTFCRKIPLSGWWGDKFLETYAIIDVDRQFGYKSGCSRVKLEENVSENRFLTATAKSAA